MSFSNINFIFIFIPIFVIIYRLAPGKARRLVVLLGSVVFYTWGTWQTMPAAIAFLAIITLVQFGLHRLEYKYRIVLEKDTKWLKILIISLAVIPLALCKVFGFMPLGISFFTFEIISLQVDLWNRQGINIEPETFTDFAGFLFMFSKLTMGPIARYEETWNTNGYIHNDNTKHIPVETLENGLKTFTLGLGLKVLLADQLATLWQSISVSGAGGITTATAWLGAITYTLELYFDFWGYSIMAIGVAALCGFELPENFNEPYSSRSVGEFWRRWHITLGAWFKDYIYIPMGGNKKGTPRNVLNLLVIWLITGIWHGNGFNFVIWGLVLFLFVLIERYTPWRKVVSSRKKQYKILSHIVLLLIMPVTWMIFAHTDLHSMLVYLLTMIGIHEAGVSLPSGQFIRYIGTYWYLLIAGITCVTPLPRLLYNKYKDKHWMCIPLIIILLASIYCIRTGTNNPFMYYQF